MRDLMAIATVRRLLLELGYELQPEAAGTLVGPLVLWIAEPRTDLDGLTPLEVLSDTDGEARLSECLRRILAAANKPSPGAPQDRGE